MSDYSEMTQNDPRFQALKREMEGEPVIEIALIALTRGANQIMQAGSMDRRQIKLFLKLAVRTFNILLAQANNNDQPQ